MNLSEHDITLIEKYILDEIEEEEKIEFERKCNPASEFEAEYQRQLDFIRYVEASEQAKLKKELKQLFTTNKNKKTKVIRISPLWYSIAASVLILLSFSYYLWQSTAINHEEIYASYYEPYYGGPVLRGEESDFNNALLKYYDRDYQNALLDLRKLKSADTLNDKIPLLIANCYLNLDSLPQASLVLTEVLEEGKSAQKLNHAKWYQALILIKLNRLPEAKELLIDLKEDVFYKEQVENLREELD